MFEKTLAKLFANSWLHFPDSKAEGRARLRKGFVRPRLAKAALGARCPHHPKLPKTCVLRYGPDLALWWNC